MFTITNACQAQSSSKATPNDSASVGSPKKSANSTESTEMENFYASIISASLEYLKAAK